jgi:gluconokinase
LAEATPDAHGLTVLPMWAGERSPGWRAEAVGTLHGLRPSTTPTDIVQALMESVALRLAQVAEDVGVSGAVWAGGGALTASPAWAHIVCNALNQPLQWVDAPEVSARGVALWMWRALDGIDPAAHPPHLRATLTPNPEAVARLASARGRQRRLYDALG